MKINPGFWPFSSIPPKLVVPKVELNIRVDVPGGGSIEANTQRAEGVIGYLRQKIDKAQFRRRAWLDGPDLLWAGTSIDVDEDNLDKVAYKVAEIAQQECVAVYLRCINRGKLIGPNARNWGQFNINAFHSFSLEE